HLEVLGREAHRFSGSGATGPRDGVEHGALDGERPLIAEPPGSGGAGRLRDAARVSRVVRAVAISLQPLEHPGERSLTHLAGAARRNLEAAAPSLHEPGLLQGPLDLSQPPQVADGRFTEGAPKSLFVDVLQRRSRVVAAHRAIELLEVV